MHVQVVVGVVGTTKRVRVSVTVTVVAPGPASKMVDGQYLVVIGACE